jgi:hypothetical protein
MPRCGAGDPGREPEPVAAAERSARSRIDKLAQRSSLNCAAFCLSLRSRTRRRGARACVNPLRSNEKTRRLLDLSEAIG